MDNKLVATIISAVVAIIIIGSALMSVIDNDLVVRQNNDYGSVAEYTDVDWTAEMEVVDQKINWVVDGVEQTDFMMKRSGRIYLVLSDTNYFFYDQTNALDIPSNSGIAYINDEGKAVTLTGVIACSIVASNGTITYTPTLISGVTNPIVIEYDWMFVANDMGNYRSLNLANYASASIVFNSPSQIYGVNYVESADDVWFSFNGGNVRYGLSDLSMNIESVKIGENISRSVVDLTDSDWSFNIDVDGEPYQVNPYIWIVPHEVSGTVTGIPSSVENIVGAIPIMLIVAVLLAIITAFFRTRY